MRSGRGISECNQSAACEAKLAERSLSRINCCKRHPQAELIEVNRIVRQRGVIPDDSPVVTCFPIVREFIVHVGSGQISVCQRVTIEPDVGETIILLRPANMVDQIMPDSLLDYSLGKDVGIHIVQPILERESCLAISRSIENRKRGVV